jgi:2-isopropylmalate synthase
VPRAIVHVYNSTSPVQREWVFGADRDGVKAIAVRGAELLQREAAKYPGTDWTFQYSPESFSQTEPDYAVEVCNAVIDVWQPTRSGRASSTAGDGGVGEPEPCSPTRWSGSAAGVGNGAMR